MMGNLRMVDAFALSRFKLILSELNNDFQVLAFKGREVVDQPYFIKLQLVSEHPSLDLEALLHQPAYLDFGEAAPGCTGRSTQSAGVTQVFDSPATISLWPRAWRVLPIGATSEFSNNAACRRSLRRSLSTTAY